MRKSHVLRIVSEAAQSPQNPVFKRLVGIKGNIWHNVKPANTKNVRQKHERSRKIFRSEDRKKGEKMNYKQKVLGMIEARTDDPNARVYKMLYTVLHYNPEPVKKDLYTLEEVRQIIGVTQRTMYRMIKSGRLHATKPGRTYVVTAEEVERIKKGFNR